MSREGILIVDRTNRVKGQKMNDHRGFDEYSYRGFDGHFFYYEEYWEIFKYWMDDNKKTFEITDGVLPLKYLNDILEYQSFLELDIDILILSRSEEIKKYKGFSFIGFDYGRVLGGYNSKDGFYCESYFSVVIQEIDNLNFSEFMNKLNNYHLFSDVKDVKELRLLRDKAFNGEVYGISFEPGVKPDECEIVQVHLYDK